MPQPMHFTGSIYGRLSSIVAPPAVGYFDVAGKDCLGADRADFLADHATRVHRPGEATALIVKRGPGLDRPFSFERPNSYFLDDREISCDALRGKQTYCRACSSVRTNPSSRS